MNALHKLMVCLFGLVLLTASAGSSAQSAANANFDHITTGFALTGLHAKERCESCHLKGVFKGTPRDCVSCHSAGSRWARGSLAKPVNHLPTTLACDSCHNTLSFAGARFNHGDVRNGTCNTCHNGTVTAGKPNGHITTTASCDSCHKTRGWLPASGFDHSGVATGSCATCHGAGRATGKSALHMPVAASTACDSCHKSFSAWRPSAWNHTQLPVTAQCASCHSGAYPPADGRPANHIPYQTLSGVAIANCDSCHKGGYTAWAPAKLHTSVSISMQCANCHTGSYPNAVGKPNTTVHVGATTCENCHKSTSSWASAKVDHSTYTAATNCANCHNGSSATGKPAAHIPTGSAANCTTCHNTKAWRPSAWNHTQLPVTAQCSSCHSGAYPPADGRPANHIPYLTLSGVAIANCDSCHRSGYAAWAPARLHASLSISIQCANCHTGSYPPAVGKPNTAVHVGVTTCESCHKSTANWTTVNFTHSAANAVGTGTCDSCHNGSTAKGKPTTHIPVTTGVTKCDNCHKSQASFATAVTMNHTVVATSACKSCHSGSYVSQGTQGALAKPANHIPEATQLLNGSAMDCNSCHKSTSAWGTTTMNHNGSLGGGAGWCKGCHASGTAFLGSMDKKALTHQKKTPPAIDCSESGCHRPLGNKGTPYTKWD